MAILTDLNTTTADGADYSLGQAYVRIGKLTGAKDQFDCQIIFYKDAAGRDSNEILHEWFVKIPYDTESADSLYTQAYNYIKTLAYFSNISDT